MNGQPAQHQQGDAAQQPNWQEVVAQLIQQQNAIRQSLGNVVQVSHDTVVRNADRPGPNSTSGIKPPRYNGSSDGNTWSTFRAQFTTYASIRWGDAPTEEQIIEQKKICYLSIGKSAARLLTGLGPTSAAFQGAATLEDYLALLNDTFRPTSEVNLARQRFRQRKQDPKESVQMYANSKEELFSHAYQEEYSRGDVGILVAEFIDGLFNRSVFEFVNNNTPYATMQACVNTALKSVATQRTSVRQGRRKNEGGLVTSLFEVDADHLRFGGAAASAGVATKTDVPVPMEIGQLGYVGDGAYGGAYGGGDEATYDDGGEDDDGYYNYPSIDDEAIAILEDPDEAVAMLCEHLGALSANGFSGNCYRCGILGHSARYCPQNQRSRGRGPRGRGRFRRARGGRGAYNSRGRGGPGFGRGTSLPPRNSMTGRFIANNATNSYRPAIGQLEAVEEDGARDEAADQGEEHADGLNM